MLAVAHPMVVSSCVICKKATTNLLWQIYFGGGTSGGSVVLH